MSNIKPIIYFAYGSNLNKERMNNRVGIVFKTYGGFIKDYKLEFNKKSSDGSSKANLTEEIESEVWGVCYELDESGFEKLREFEKGYFEREVIVYNEKQELLAIAKTFVSDKICDKLPTKKYLNIIIDGAKQHELPEDYIQKLKIQKFIL